MRFPLRSGNAHEPIAYQSHLTFQSASIPGVSFTVLRMSFGRRMDLFRKIRELSGSLQYLECSADFREQVEASLLGQEIENLYLRWGLVSVEGLSIDGEPANLETLIESGPESLSREIVSAIKVQCGLSPDERKN
jgi:hypothetical protein